MSNLVKILSPEWVRGILAVLFGFGIIVAMFMGLFPAEQFTPIATMILGYFFGRGNDKFEIKNEVAKRVNEQNK